MSLTENSNQVCLPGSATELKIRDLAPRLTCSCFAAPYPDRFVPTSCFDNIVFSPPWSILPKVIYQVL